MNKQIKEIVDKKEFTGIECCILWTYDDFENGKNEAAKENAENAAAELAAMREVIDAARNIIRLRNKGMVVATFESDLDALAAAFTKLDGQS